MKKALTVEDRFIIQGKGIVVSPWIPLDFFEGKLLPNQVELRFKDKSKLIKEAAFSVPRISHSPKNHVFGCFIKDIDKSECPVGTEIWVELQNSELE